MVSIASLQVGTKVAYLRRGQRHTGTVKSLHLDAGEVRWVRVGAGTVSVTNILEVLA